MLTNMGNIMTDRLIKMSKRFRHTKTAFRHTHGKLQHYYFRCPSAV